MPVIYPHEFLVIKRIDEKYMLMETRVFPMIVSGFVYLVGCDWNKWT